MHQWEHLMLSSPGGDVGAMMRSELNRLGAEGWEVVGTAGTDKTLGFNALVVVLKRAIVPPPPLPDGTAADWYDDPCGRWERRYWNGHVWTAHVAKMTTKERGVDAPQTLPAAD